MCSDFKAELGSTLIPHTTSFSTDFFPNVLSPHFNVILILNSTLCKMPKRTSAYASDHIRCELPQASKITHYRNAAWFMELRRLSEFSLQDPSCSSHSRRNTDDSCILRSEARLQSPFRSNRNMSSLLLI